MGSQLLLKIDNLFTEDIKNVCQDEILYHAECKSVIVA